MVDMVKKPNTLQRKATQEITSGQDKTGVFKRIKTYTKHKVKAVGTLAVAAGLAWTLHTSKVTAQDMYYASNIDSTKFSAGDVLKPRTGKAQTLVFYIGSNKIYMEEKGCDFDVDITPLGKKYFDGKEKDKAVEVKGQGFVHIITHKDWTGVVITDEPDEKKKINAGATPVNDNSKVILPLQEMNLDGVLVVPTTKGIIVQIKHSSGLIMSGYFNLTNDFGIDRLENLKVEKVGTKLICTVSNTNKPVQLDLETGTTAPVKDIGSN